jgi:hypothetical protein
VFEELGAQFGAVAWNPLFGTIDVKRYAFERVPCSSRAGAILAHGATIGVGSVCETDVMVALEITKRLSGPKVGSLAGPWKHATSTTTTELLHPRSGSSIAV